MVGAAAGTAAEPGAGTVAGGIAGFVGKQAIKNLLKREVAKRILKEAGEELTEAGVRNALAKGLLKDALAAEAKKTPRMTVDRVAAQILTWWDEDCAREDAEKERAARAALLLQVRGRG
jgi:aryl-alcohol dehydrogenase-like predicted oxidoreductase